MIVTNNTGISLPLAVWLLHDEYDYINIPNYISVTSLMKPLKQIVLAKRIPPAQRTEDVEDFIARKLGTAIHDSIEKAWIDGYARSMKLLGYPQSAIDNIAINPDDDTVRASNSIIPVYLEQREIREIVIDSVTYTIGGKFDMVADGIVQDNKSTSAFSWLFGTKDDDHRLQLSLYRWLDAGRDLRRIREDYGQINYVFTDWARAQAKINPKYPQKRVEKKDLKLTSLVATEAFVREKLTAIARYMNSPEAAMPDCTDEELWRSASSYKYYADPTKISGRSTRNFDDPVEARKFMAEKGGKGAIIIKPGEVKACGYCAAFDVCKQKNQYLSEDNSPVDVTGVLSTVY